MIQLNMMRKLPKGEDRAAVWLWTKPKGEAYSGVNKAVCNKGCRSDSKTRELALTG
jgi:hypothetical protein